ncbi:MAG: DUF1016 N-terminal domain-containing protein [Lutibacter sp.]|nr:DUF1016 N-terminal domain-containing protein [Lutibacter sp.]
MIQKQFEDIITLIKESRINAFKAVNKELIGLYWAIGEYIYKRLESAEWGESVVKELAGYLQRTEPALKGFSDKNLWRMKQFFEAYSAFPKLSTLSREISYEALFAEIWDNLKLWCAWQKRPAIKKQNPICLIQLIYWQ